MALVAASAILFGTDCWARFFEKIPFMLHLMKGGYLQMHQLVSPAGALLLAGVPYPAAILIHLLVAVIGTGLTIVTWYRNRPGYIRNSLLVLTIFLVTPYANTYDLTLLGLPICWMGWEAYRKGMVSGFQSFYLVAAWLLPILTVLFAVLARMQVAPLFILCMSIWVYRFDQPRCIRAAAAG